MQALFITMDMQVIKRGWVNMLRSKCLACYIFLLVVFMVGCGTDGNSESNKTAITEEIKVKAVELVELIESSMKKDGVTISEEEFVAEMSSYQQLLLDKGEITEEMRQEFMQSFEEEKENGNLTEAMKHSYILSYRFYSYLQTLDDIGILTSDEKRLDSLIHSMWFHSLEYQSRVTGKGYNIAFFVGEDQEKKEQADEKLKEIEEIKAKSTEDLLEDYDNLFEEFKKVLTHSEIK